MLFRSTGEKALQVHAIIAYKIHYRDTADGPVKIIEDLGTVRKMLDESVCTSDAGDALTKQRIISLQRPFLTPENVMVPPIEAGDMLLFYNRGVRHSAVEFPES
mgnify:FL=1